MLAITAVCIHAQVVTEYDNLVTLRERAITAFKNSTCGINTRCVRIGFCDATITTR